VRIDGNGNWGEPVKLDSTVNSKNSEWFPKVAHDNCLYFGRDLDGNVVIHKAELINGEYKKVSKLNAAFNYNCGDQVFSKNMDYIIFSSPREGGFGNIDLYLAFKKDNGEWTEGINMGSDINTDGFELAPYISPDDKYLFFTRRYETKEAATSDIYWVSLDIVSLLKKR
jgi:Tol biopolymer transport system component